MNFNLSKEQEMVRSVMREFAKNEVEPIAAEIDETERFPRENVEKMAKANMLGIPFPVEYGGAGGDEISYAIAIEELSKVCGTTGVINSAHTSLGCWPIFKYGNEEQKQKYLVPLAKGEHLGAFGLTEPNAGTDAAGQQTTAILDGDNYILNGSKIFITNGGQADTYIIFAMTDKSKGTRGISAFIVEKDFPGFSIGKIEEKMGIRASATTELIFQSCIVPKENLLGKEAARLLVYRAAFNKANGLPYGKEAAMAKLFASECAMNVTTKCVQLFGGYGYTKDYPIERMMRDAKITEIYEGTSQVQQMVISAAVLK